MAEKLENRYIINYDVKQRIITNIKFKQGDIDSSVLEVHLLDNSVAVDITGEVIEFRFLKPDGTIVYQDITTGVTLTTPASGIVECALKSNTLAAAGVVKCEVHRAISGKQLTTPSFYFTVESSVGSIGVLSTNYIGDIETTLTGITTAENTRIANETARGISETTRQNSNVAFQLLEAYDNTHNYIPLNKVTYQGSTYQNIIACSGVLPTDITKWILIALAGSGTNVTNSTTNGNININGTDTEVYNDALKANIIDVNAQIAAVASGSPKGVYVDVSTLTAAFPTGNSNIYLIPGSGGTAEVDTLAFTAIPTTASNIIITLNGVAKTIAVDPAVQTTPTLLATLVRGNTFTGWTTGGTGTTVTFTKNIVGTNTPLVFNAGTTGVTATFTLTTAGTPSTTGNWYYWNGSAWVSGGVYQGAIIANQSIDDAQLKQTYAKVRVGKNLFNLATVIAGYYPSYSTGNLTPQSAYNCSDWIRVVPSTVYVKSDTAQIAFYDINKTFISGLAAPVSFTTPSNCYYMRIAIGDSALSVCQLELGSTKTWVALYIAAQDVNNIGLKSIQAKHLEDIYAKTLVGKNLFNVATLTLGSYPSNTTGCMNPQSGYNGSDWIPCSSSTVYAKTDNQPVAFYDVNKVFISGLTGSAATTFTTPPHCVYMRITVMDAIKATYQLELGSVATSYMAYSLGIDPNSIGLKTIEAKHLKDTYALQDNYVIKTVGKNLCDKTKLTAGYYPVSSTGVLAALATYNASDWMPVLPNTAYKQTVTQQIAFYDINKTFISGIGIVTDGAFTTPSNCCYVRTTILDQYISTYQLELGTVSTACEDYSMAIDTTQFRNKSIQAKHLQDTYALQDNYATKVIGKNMFNLAKATLDYYVSYIDGALQASSAGYNASDWIPCSGSTVYAKTDNQQIAFYDVNKVFISGIATVTGFTFTTPALCCYMRVTINSTLMGSYQVEAGTVKTAFEPYALFVPASAIDPALTNGLLNFESDMSIELPKYIYLVIGEEFNVYWRNVIKQSGRMKSGSYYVRAEKNTAGVYSAIGNDYGYKWCYTPTVAEQYDLEIRLYNNYNDTCVTTKVVTIVVVAKNQLTAKKATTVTLGDSFTDGYDITKYMYDFVTAASNVTMTMLGLNDGDEVGVKDDAWSGYSYNWFATSATGYLRSDRPLADANWDAGWGLNEINGWTTGQTYADLTPTQITHGFTRNEFWNQGTSKFDFGYYMAQRYPAYVPFGQTGSHVDSVVSFLGLNDAIWNTPTALKAVLAVDKTYIDGIINSIHAWDPAIIIMLHLVPPQMDGDSFMDSYGATFLHSDRAKYCQEIWNDFMLINYSSDAMRAANVYVAATNANFDTRVSTLSKTITPQKYNLSYTEQVSSDVHPSTVGAKYIADTTRNFIIAKVIK